MEIVVHGKHTPVSDSLDAFAREKIGRLSRYLPTISQIDVELYEEGKHKDSCIHCEVTVLADGHTFRATTSAGDFHECIDITLDRLKGQLTDHNRKKSGKPAHARHGKEPIPGAPLGELELDRTGDAETEDA